MQCFYLEIELDQGQLSLVNLPLYFEKWNCVAGDIAFWDSALSSPPDSEPQVAMLYNGKNIGPDFF